MSPTPERSNDVDDDYSFSSDSEYKMDSLYLVLSLLNITHDMSRVSMHTLTLKRKLSHMRIRHVHNRQALCIESVEERNRK